MGRLHKAYPPEHRVSSSDDFDELDDDSLSTGHVKTEDKTSSPPVFSISCSSKYDRALLDLFMRQRIRSMHMKLGSENRNNPLLVETRSRNKPNNVDRAAFTRYSVRYFYSVLKLLNDHQRSVIQSYGYGFLLKYEKTDVPIKYVKWIARKFNVGTSDLIINNRSIPISKEIVRVILGLPPGHIALVPDSDAGKKILLSHFGLDEIPQLYFFGDKLKNETDMSDDDIFICFMIVAFCSFLCPNSSNKPKTKYFAIFGQCQTVRDYDLAGVIYNYLVNSISKFKNQRRLSGRKSKLLGGCHYVLAVNVLDCVDFGAQKIDQALPRISVWKGNMIINFSELDHSVANSYGYRPVKKFSSTCYYKVANNYEKQQSNHCISLPSSSVLLRDKLETTFGHCLPPELILGIVNIVNTHNADESLNFSERSEIVAFNIISLLAAPAPNKNLDLNIKDVRPSSTLSPKDKNASSPTAAGKDCSAMELADEIIKGAQVCDDYDFHNCSAKLSETNNVSDSVKKDSHKLEGIPEFHGEIIDRTKANATVANTDVSSTPQEPHKPQVGMTVDQSNKEGMVIQKGALMAPIKKRKLNNFNFSSPMKRLLDHVPSFQMLPEWEDETDKVPKVLLDHQGSMGNGSVQKPHIEVAHIDNSPLIPVRLSPIFLEQMNSGRLSQQKSQNVNKSKNTKTAPDVINLSDSPHLAAPQDKENMDPNCHNPTLPASLKLSGEVQVLRDKPFTEICNDISKKVDARYNIMMNVTNHQGKVSSSRPSVSGLGVDGTDTYANPIKNSSRKVRQQRCVAPSNQLKDPFVLHPGHFPISHLDHVHYQVLCRIGEDSRYKNAMAVQFDSVWSSYESLSSLKPDCRVDNFLISYFCRKLFFDIHPRQSKRHCFFPFIGDAILNHNQGVVQTAFLGANRAYEMWFSDLLFFPICHKEHWFTFVVCLKQKLFCFLDSFFSGNDSYYRDLRDIIIDNFVMLWEDIVQETMVKRVGYRIQFEEFKVTHPSVPKQIGNKNCGVFSMKFMEVWKPGLHLANVFSNHDINNIRVQYANQLYFHNLNMAERNILPNFVVNRVHIK